jgi:hypothetical protein
VWWPGLKEKLDHASSIFPAEEHAKGVDRTFEEMVVELLDLARAHEKALANAVDLLANSNGGSSGTIAVGEKEASDTSFGEVTYLLARIRAIVNWAARAGEPETAIMVQLRALVKLLESALSSMIDARGYQSMVERYEVNMPDITDK